MDAVEIVEPAEVVINNKYFCQCGRAYTDEDLIDFLDYSDAYCGESDGTEDEQAALRRVNNMNWKCRACQE